MNIVLIGMRGSGKTTIGKVLAERLSRSFIETDREIERKTGRSISDFVKTNGWTSFRDVEEQVVKDIAYLDNLVIATGGGIVERSNNIKQFKDKGILVWLVANLTTYVKRIKSGRKRPFLTDAKKHSEDIRKTLETRKKLYTQASDVIVNTEDKTVNNTVYEIIESVKNYD